MDELKMREMGWELLELMMDLHLCLVFQLEKARQRKCLV